MKPSHSLLIYYVKCPLPQANQDRKGSQIEKTGQFFFKLIVVYCLDKRKKKGNYEQISQYFFTVKKGKGNSLRAYCYKKVQQGH